MAERTGTDTLPAVWMRGGTSKGIFLHERDLPPAGPARDAVLLDILGSPDPMQIDGLGGAYSSTSKAVVVGAVGDEVRYWFAQIGVDSPVVDWSGNCGNLTTAVGPFAVDEQLVDATEPVTTVVLRNMNTGVRIAAEVPVQDGRARAFGDQHVPGVPHPGAPVATDYLDPGGKVLGAALPTGSATDLVRAPDGDVAVSLVDVTHPYAFVRADDVGLSRATATPAELNSDRRLLDRLERIRGSCAVHLGLVSDWREVGEVSPVVPRLVVVDDPTGHTEEVCALGVSMGAVHHALQMTGALALAAAVRIPGTVPHSVAGPAGPDAVRIRHPKGVVTARSDVTVDDRTATVGSVGLVRTARRLMAGVVHLREPLPAGPW